MNKKKVYIEIELGRFEVEYLLTSLENTCTKYGIKYKISSDDSFYEEKYGVEEK